MAARQLKNWVRKSALRTIPKPIEPLGRWRVVSGDTVIVVSGEDSGKTGKIKAVLRTRNRVLVEGVNLVRKAVRPVEGVAGGIISVEAPIHVSNVNLVDPSTGKPTKVGIRYTADGAKVRIARKTGTIIPTPERASMRAPRPAEPGPRDTPAAEVSQQTYFPPAELVPFLVGAKAADNAQSIFRARRTGDDDKLPDVFRLPLRRVDRNKLRARFERKVTVQRVASLVRSAPAAAELR